MSTFKHPDEDLDRELSQWVDELAARYEAQGLSPAEARRRALVETEGVEQVKERVRDARRLSSVPLWLADKARLDLAMAWRSLRATPAATLAAVLTLAMAVGLNIAMAGLVDRGLLSPPAGIDEPSRLFTLRFRGEGQMTNAIQIGTSYSAFRTIRREVPSLAGAAAFQRAPATVLVDGDQQSVTAMQVSDDYFTLLGARPRIGAGILPAGAGPGAPIAVISHAFWHSAFGGDAGVVGTRLVIRGVDHTVAGVMPEGFSGHSSVAVDVWTPISNDLSNASIIVRLRPDTRVEAAETQVTSAAGARAAFSPIAGTDVGANERRIAWWLTGLSALVLVIGLANASTLLAVRASKRRREIAIRAALGASRARLASQALLEAVLIAGAATAVSVMVSGWLDESIRRLLFPRLVTQVPWGVPTLVAAASAGVLAAVVAGAVNVWQLRAPRPGEGVSTSRAGRARTLKSLLLIQTALSVLLLAGAGLFGRSFYNLAAQDLGMELDRVVIAEFGAGPGSDRFGDLFGDALETVRSIPGVDIATVISSVPFGGHHVPPISVPGRAEPPSVGGQLPFLNAATPEFLKILGVRIVEGRTFTAEDDRGAPVVIVNETMAREVWPGEQAIGKCIRIGFDPDFDPATATGPPVPSAAVPCRQVVGVARDVRQRSLVPVDHEARLMQYFVPFSQVPYPPFISDRPRAHGLLLKVGAGHDALVQPIRRAVIGSRQDLPFLRVVPYSELLEPQLRPWRTASMLLALFSTLALIVSTVGLYATFAHAVAERRHEMAIRLAIGARPDRVRWMVLREALALAAYGAAAGCVAAVFGGRWVESLLFQTEASDPFVLGAAAVVMLIVAAGATFLPARAAARADPNALLKAE